MHMIKCTALKKRKKKESTGMKVEGLDSRNQSLGMRV